MIVTADTIHQHLWGKTVEGNPSAFHPLFCHMADVGMVARVILRSPDASHFVRGLARVLGMDEHDVAVVVPLLVALHDIGKASPSFEAKAPVQWARVQGAGFTLPVQPIDEFNHALESRVVLPKIVEELGLLAPSESQPAKRLYDNLAHGLGAHHGTFFTAHRAGYPEIPTEQQPADPWQDIWRRARQELTSALRDVFLTQPAPVKCEPTNLSAACMLLCGLTVLADWIGSDARLFEAFSGDLNHYPVEAETRAAKAVATRELLSYLPPSTEEPSFRRLFPAFSGARPLQEAFDPEKLPGLPSQLLAIIEAPTGEGKTEAALLLAARLEQRGRLRGFYFALPTMATSNQMFNRVLDYLRKGLGAGGRANLLLVHGQASLSDELARLVKNAQHAGLEPDDAVVADSWLLPRKRSLLSPYGVGTVDQAMVGALNVRYGVLRLFGLANKVVIIDEVHAYDVYMTTILDRLLTWLGALGASVILLSATLPRARREKLIEAFRGTAQAARVHPDRLDPYPLITLVDMADPSRPERQLLPTPSEPTRQVDIRSRQGGMDQRRTNAQLLVDEVANGGCAAWICNTVAEAQACYLALKSLKRDLPLAEKPELLLFHARFPFGVRSEIEQQVFEQFGPDGGRPARAIVVATQVIEQSADLDFDIMMSQIAPIDLLLQRAGRIWRHRRSNRRWRGAAPILILLDPPEPVAGSPNFESYGRVYEPWILLRTIAALRGRKAISVPGDVRELVESVYQDEPDPLAIQLRDFDPGVIEDAKARSRRRREKLKADAKQRLLAEPYPRGGFAANPGLVFDEDEGSADLTSWFAGQTRYEDEPGVRAILVDRADPLAAELIAASERRRSSVDRDDLRQALRRSVRLSGYSLTAHIRDATGKTATDNAIYRLDNVRGLQGYVLICLAGNRYEWTHNGKRDGLEVREKLGVVFDHDRLDEHK